MFRNTFTSSSHKINLSVFNSSFVDIIMKISIPLNHFENTAGIKVNCILNTINKKY